MTPVESQKEILERARPHLPPAPEGLRERALESFASAGFPHTRLEDWKYTSLREIAEGDFAPAPEPAFDAGAEEMLRRASIDARELSFVNGRCIEPGGSARPPAGLRMLSLDRALRDDADLVERLTSSLADVHRSSLVALNTAFLGSGTFIDVADDTVVEEPIHLLYGSLPAGPGRARGEASATHVRTLVRLGRNSRATVIEHFLGLAPGSYWTNSATDVALGRGARLAHYKVQRESTAAYHTADIAAAQESDSELHSISIALGARLCRNDVITRLVEPGAHCSFDGLYVADDRQHVDHHTSIDHAAPSCTSQELYKGILGGRSVGVFNGKVLVRNEAQRTDASQLNKNLLLSDLATINTKPQLEIFADDVKCSHGATTGRLDEDSIFYLRTRGIDRAAARALLTYAFANEVVERIATPSLREQLESAVHDRVAEIGGFGGDQ